MSDKLESPETKMLNLEGIGGEKKPSVASSYLIKRNSDKLKFKRWTQRWIHGVYGVALVSPLVIEENGAFNFKTHLTMETEKEMQKFTAKIVDMMKQEKLYASQGGLIILSQIENEYGNVNSAYGAAVKPYIKWAASMDTSLDTGMPLIQ
ncbi:hypothetical protein Syun_001197 [Stephania yunnanensis]|uniref:beta-galactosidase n=1 Tax=Stephania yunnanensis TaxID=152371 RepID=A0AAP0Q615_9MAGN